MPRNANKETSIIHFYLKIVNKYMGKYRFKILGNKNNFLNNPVDFMCVAFIYYWFFCKFIICLGLTLSIAIHWCQPQYLCECNKRYVDRITRNSSLKRRETAMILIFIKYFRFLMIMQINSKCNIIYLLNASNIR